MKENSYNSAPLNSTIDVILLKALGYGLLLLGVISAAWLLYNVWIFYSNPEQVNYFAVALQGQQQAINMDANNYSIMIRIAAWQIVLMLLLCIGKITMWVIEAGQNLVNSGSMRKK